MNRQKELAAKVMKLANDFTGWNFQMHKDGSIYYVETELHNQKGQNMKIYYLIGKENAQLMVLSTDGRYDGRYAGERIEAMPLGYSAYSMEMGAYSLAINSSIPIDVLDSQMGTIVMKRMTDMAEAMTDIINYSN